MICLDVPDSDGGEPTTADQIHRLRAICDATASKLIKEAVTVTVLTQVEQRYGQYLQCGGDPKKLSPSPFVQARKDAVDSTAEESATLRCDALESCYASKAVACENVKALVRNVAKGDCPYCAMRLPKIKDRHSLDHYLPKKQFPEFSILPQNLVQACNGCNSPKRSNFKMKDGTRAFIHPYYTDLGTKPILKAHVQDKGGAPFFTFKLELANLSESVSATVEHHVTELGLLQRWAEYALEEPLSLLRAYARMWQGTRKEDCIRKMMREQAETEQNELLNSPKAAALLALSVALELPKWLDNILPHPTKSNSTTPV